MSKRFIGLEWRLVLVVAIAFAAALTVFVVTQNLGNERIDEAVSSDEFWEKSQNELLTRMQSQITRRHLATTNTQELTGLARDLGVYALYLVKDGYVIFDSLGQTTGIPADELYSQTQVYAMAFSDGEADVAVYYDPTWAYYGIVYTLSWVLSALVFLLLFILMIRRRLRYILTLQQETRVLEGGDLSHEITVSGGDELTRLAATINEMRLSILDRQSAQERAEMAGRRLVATMSHDLRTPLTALIGYLELINAGKYEGEPERARFELCALEKSYRIKNMTDELFTYALGELNEPTQRQVEIIQMDLLLQQIVTEEQFDLENAGLRLEWSEKGAGCVRADPQRLLRVFDNLFSNARFYASPLKPVQLDWTCENGSFRVDMTSAIRLDAPEGTGLGLSSCESILGEVGGSIQTHSENGMFHVTIRLPLCRAETR